MAAPSGPTSPPASLSSRIAAYLIDSAVLVVVLLVFFIIGGAVLLFSSDLGKNDPPDAAFTAFIAILIGGPLLFWTAFNLALNHWRAQTAGMYVVGIKASPIDSAAAQTPRLLLLRWFGLHPVLYHPLFVPVWALLSAYGTSLTLSRTVLIVTLALVLLCLVAPAAGFAAIALDPERRGIHDRLGRTRVVSIDHS